MTNWVISYDICDPRRLGRVHRRMLAHAAPIEYSVFLLDGTQRALEACMEEIVPLIEETEDDVRCYQLPERGLKARVGVSALPAGIQWTGLPAAWVE